MQCKIDPEASLCDVPAIQKKRVPKPLKYYAEVSGGRDFAVRRAYESGGYSMREIGEYFGLHYSRVSRIINRKAKGKTLLTLKQTDNSHLHLPANMKSPQTPLAAS